MSIEQKPYIEHSRTQEVDRALLEELTYAVFDPQIREPIVGKLPNEMTPEEVLHLGTQINSYMEEEAPSKDGFSNGKYFEERTINMIGMTSVIRGDLISAQSCIDHLNDVGGFKNRFKAFRIARERDRRIRF